MGPTDNESKALSMSEAGLEQGVAITPVSSESDANSDKRVSAGALSESDESLDMVDDDIDKMLSELQDFQEELETKSKSPDGDGLLSPGLPQSASDPLDQFRLSMNVIEGTGEVDLDALLEDLCVMERDINSANTTEADTQDRAEDMDHANLKSPISPTAKVSADVRNRLENIQEETKELTPEEQQERLKAEKIRIALEKLRAARVKKLVIKVHNDEDSTSKTLAIDQTWTAWDVCKKMMKKNDAEPDPNWVLVERMPDLFIERLLEDHESVVDVVSSWPWDSNNKLVLNNRREKYSLFRNPQNYLLTSDTSTGAAQLAEKSKDILLTEYFKKDAMRLPELDGVMHLKEGKRSWKKHYFALRASGVYVNPKGKTKSSKDLVCLIKPEYVDVYYGLTSIKKKLKAPTEFCFVLKSPQLSSLDSKAFVCLCADEQRTMQRWMVAIRIAKYGYRMLEDYSETQDEMEKLAFTLDRNRFTRNSFSAPSLPQPEPELQPQAPPKDYSLKARVQSERLKQNTVHQTGYQGSASFSLRRPGKEPARKNPAKNIGNLFSDAWKKGSEKHFEPASPDYATIGPSPGAVTPNTTSPKAFVIEANRAIQTLDDVNDVEDEDGEAEPPALPPALALEEPEVAQETPPLPRKLSATRDLQDGAVYAEIPDTQARNPPPRPLSDADIPPPPPPVPSTPRPSTSAHAASSCNSLPLPGSPPPTDVTSPRVLPPPYSPGPDEVFHPPPPPPPPKAKHMATSLPPANLLLDPPSLHSSTDSLPLPPPPAQFTEDDMPLPPPPGDPPVADADFPPPPPDVLKEQINASLLRRSQSSKHPPPPPPKTNRPRLSNRSASFN